MAGYDIFDKTKMYLMAIGAGLLAFVILWYKLGSFPFGLVVSITGSLLVALLSYLVVTENE